MFDNLEEFYWPFAVAIVAILTLSVTYEVYGRTHLSWIDPLPQVLLSGLYKESFCILLCVSFSNDFG